MSAESLTAAMALLEAEPAVEPAADAAPPEPQKPAAEAEKPAEEKPPEPAPPPAAERTRLLEMARREAKAHQQLRELQGRLTAAEKAAEDARKAREQERAEWTRRVREDPTGFLAEHGLSYEGLTERVLKGDRTPTAGEVELRRQLAEMQRGREEDRAWREQAEQREQQRAYEAADARERAAAATAAAKLPQADRDALMALAGEGLTTDDVAEELVALVRQMQDGEAQAGRAPPAARDVVAFLAERARKILGVRQAQTAAARPAAATLSRAATPATAANAPRTREERLRAAQALLAEETAETSA